MGAERQPPVAACGPCGEDGMRDRGPEAEDTSAEPLHLPSLSLR